ncbi:hypothetical protein OH807_11165 [Kitasatospora sp. NBC_01560]
MRHLDRPAELTVDQLRGLPARRVDVSFARYVSGVTAVWLGPLEEPAG